MSNLMLASAVKAELAVSKLREALTTRRERGAEALEYIGMVVLAALIIGGIFTVATDLDLKGEFQRAAESILNR